ncbi:hypothetical protein Tco_0500487, partial [Tanacetum coccineum]
MLSGRNHLTYDEPQRAVGSLLDVTIPKRTRA